MPTPRYAYTLIPIFVIILFRRFIGACCNTDEYFNKLHETIKETQSLNILSLEYNCILYPARSCGILHKIPAKSHKILQECKKKGPFLVRSCKSIFTGQWVGTDALHLPWDRWEEYAFPPFCLIERCSRKVREDKASLVLMASGWRSQTWYLALLELLVNFALILPRNPTSLTDLFNNPHPLVAAEKLQLVA